MMKNIAISTDLNRSVCAALKAANAESNDGVERCFDILRYLKSLNLSVKDLYHSKSIHTLSILREHGDPKIRMGADALFESWMKTLYCSGRDPPSTCNKAVPRVCSGLKKKETRRDIKLIDHRKPFAAARPLLTHKQTLVPVIVSENPRSCPSSKSARDNTCKTKFGLSTQKTARVFSRLNKTEAERSLTHETGEIKRDLSKADDDDDDDDCKREPKYCPGLRKKNATEMLELFGIAKKTADVANAKGLLLAKAEASICVDTLSLLLSFPISSTASETKQIMERLAHLTRHKDRKICNSASALLQHWSQSIRDQQRQDSSTKTRR